MVRNYKIKISSHNLNSIKQIKNCLKTVRAKGTKLVTLPKKSKVFTISRSPHVNNKAKEHFKIEKHHRVAYLQVTIPTLKQFLGRLPNDLLLKVVELR